MAQTTVLTCASELRLLGWGFSLRVPSVREVDQVRRGIVPPLKGLGVQTKRVPRTPLRCVLGYHDAVPLAGLGRA